MRNNLVLAFIISSFLLGCSGELEQKLKSAEERAIAAEKRAAIAEEKLDACVKQGDQSSSESRYEKSEPKVWTLR